MMRDSKEIFSFHLVNPPPLKIPWLLSHPPRLMMGLNHAESFITMNLGHPILSPRRYGLKTMATLAWWRDEDSLDGFLRQHLEYKNGWHIRMKLYRRWGEVAEIKNAVVDANLAAPDQPVVAVTLARLNLMQTRRFIIWGKPVERQVRDHQSQTMALAGIRPANTFLTFSIWKNEIEMINMVHGKDRGGDSHLLAMQERSRKDFHHEFTTMRFRATSLGLA